MSRNSRGRLSKNEDGIGEVGTVVNVVEAKAPY
jgi:hypothetical protein